mgnify:CR=1 FL=1
MTRWLATRLWNLATKKVGKQKFITKNYKYEVEETMYGVSVRNLITGEESELVDADEDDDFEHNGLVWVTDTHEHYLWQKETL